MEKGIIYKVENKVTGKCYVGQTIRTLNQRKCGHKSHANCGQGFNLHESIRKYGWNNFEWEVLNICNEDDLEKWELYYIKKYNSLEPNGYNMTLRTCGNLGYDFSGENNPRYGDHRNYEEIHGKEKAKILKKSISKRMKKSENNIINWKMENPEYNPMNYKKHRKTLSKMRMGNKNPMATYIYTFILPNGIKYKTDCLREFCRNTGFKRHTLTRIANNKNYTPRSQEYKGWICNKTEKEEVV